MRKTLFTKKTISSLLSKAAENTGGLQRTLGAMNLTAMGIGAIIGAGLFVMTGQVAADFTGPGIIISFIIAAIICSFAALCYAEFASLIPIAGSAYTYAYVTLGELAAWILGLALTMEYLFSFCTVAVGWSGYFVSLMRDFGIYIPDVLSKSPLIYSTENGWMATGSIINLPAVIIIGLVGTLVSVGIKTATTLNNLLVFVKVGVIVLFVGFGLASINADNWVPFIPENTGFFGEFGWSGVMRGAGVVFFAFLGFDAISTLAQESKNPQRDMPIGMLASLGICTLLYIVFGLVLTGVVNYKFLGVSDPIAVAVDAFGPQFTWLRFVVKIAILSGLTSVILVMLVGQSRIFYAMANDGLLPEKFASTHPKFKTPFFTTIFLVIVGVLLGGFFPVNILGQLTSMGALFVFGMVCFGVLVLRITQPHLPRPFKTPFSPLVPLLGTLACVGQMILMPLVTWIQMGIFMAFGLVLYFIYGNKHSKIQEN